MKVVALAGAILALGGLASIAQAEEVTATNRDRVFVNYTREAATVGAGVLRLEVKAFHTEDQSNSDLDTIGFPVERVENREGDEIDATTGNVIDVLGSFGIGQVAEVGFDLPIVLQEYERVTLGSKNVDGVGDLSLYGKFKYKAADRVNVGGGVELSVPTGPEDKYTGTGEVGVNPFVSTRYEYKRFAVGGHLGYQFYTGNVKNVLNYSAHAIVKATSTVAFRTEISGRNFKQYGQTFDDVLVYPGFDLDFFDWIAIRPTGMFNLTSESQDWGVGVGFATHFTLF
jgi:hypothetical protein